MLKKSAPTEAVRPITVEVITYAPTAFYHCQHCELTFQQMGVGDRVHREQAREALPDDLRQEFYELTDRIHELIERHGEAVRVKLIDAASIEGVWKSLRHRVHRYPAVIIEGKRGYLGSDPGALGRHLSPHLPRTKAHRTEKEVAPNPANARSTDRQGGMR